MWKDPVVEEVRKNRDQLAKRKNYSLRKIFGEMQKERASKIDKDKDFLRKKNKDN